MDANITRPEAITAARILEAQAKRYREMAGLTTDDVSGRVTRATLTLDAAMLEAVAHALRSDDRIHVLKE